MSGSLKPYTTDMDINSVKVSMQIDTGSAFSVISVEKFQQLNLKSTISQPVPILKSYTGNDLKIINIYEVPVTYLNKCYSLPLIVVDCMDKPTLLGREWMKKLNIKIDDCVIVVLDKNVDFNNVNFDNASSTVEYFKNKFSNCFNLNDTSGILGEPINIAMKQETIPIFCKSKPVPYSLRNLVDKALDTLINSGVLHTVSHSKWATPIVAIPELNGNGRETVRICGDFSVTVNKLCETQFYPLPSQEEILTSMGDGKSNGIHTINSPPYHRNSNGAAENSVSVVKNMLKRQALSNRKYDNFQHRLDSALFAYRNTPSSVTLKTPAELLFRYLPQTTITKFRSNHLSKEKRYQDYQKSYFNRNAVKRNFDINDRVWVKPTRNENVKWYPGKITKVISLNTFVVSINNKISYVHSDHLRKSEVDVVDDSNFSKFRITMDSDVNIPSVINAILPALDIAIIANEEIIQDNSTNDTLSNAELSTSNSVSSPISESVTSPIKSTRPSEI
ncbi:hypothetical protein AVEN_256354-1 [Araneus ventricosus]|uniref:Integrase catalytic domain-containing protein n=1 Tax=Araneus ventricosus TaxID=182803 RepID=A0A4Y2U3G5_ARAVE|nr:hypothetical protein AVEN_256354-1 [Araneus ventricosus]